MLPATWELQVSVEFRKVHFGIKAECPTMLKTPDLTTHDFYSKKK